MRPLIGIIGVIVFAVIAVLATAGRGGGALAVPAASPGAVAVPSASQSARPSPLPSPETLATHIRLVRGFSYPVSGMDVPLGESYLPNSPREYRSGYHEGIDFVAKAGTPVLAAKAGTIARIDAAFKDWSAAQEQAAFAAAQALGYTPDATLDRIRGRQVWIDHGGGVVTRYAHLSEVAPLRVGDVLSQGQVIGAVGSSGYPVGGPHLHFEIRDGDGFYGDGLALPQLRYAIAAAFR